MSSDNLKDKPVIAIVPSLMFLRGRNTQVNEGGQSLSSEDKIADVDTDNSVERVPEDLAGRVCYELEPLVLS